MNETRIISCATCPCGRAAGVGAGGRCPFVDRRRQPGELIYLEGEPATHVWFVKRGTVVLTRTLRDDEGTDAARAVRGAGAFLGLEALVRSSYLDTARVTAQATLCGAPREAIDQWLGQAGSPARMALEQVLRMTSEDPPRGSAVDGRAVRRVARWLLTGEGASNGQVVPRRYVAGLLGMVPETLSRTLAQLAKSGTVEVTRRSLRVRDPDRLRTLAGL